MRRSLVRRRSPVAAAMLRARDHRSLGSVDVPQIPLLAGADALTAASAVHDAGIDERSYPSPNSRVFLGVVAESPGESSHPREA
jgi:hypothetical protein